MQCANHPAVDAVTSCARCDKGFCNSCLVSFKGETLCGSCKKTAVRELESGVNSYGLDYASFGTRFLAVFLDGLIMMLISFPVQFGLAFSNGGQPPSNFSLISIFFSYVVPAIYESYLVYKYGATLGKMAVKIVVVNPDGTPLTPGQSVGRHFAKYISAITLLIGYIMAGFDKEGRSMHDRICGTRVIKKS